MLGNGSVVRRWGTWLACLLVASELSAQEPATADDFRQGVAAASEAFVKAFNAHDAQQVAALWLPDAVHEQKSLGAKLAGREALQQAYAQLFKNDPKAQMTAALVDARQVAAGVVSADYMCSVAHTDGEATYSQFNAIWVTRDGRWMLSQVLETDVTPTSPSQEALAELAWFVGTWSDASQDVLVTNQVRWAEGGNFLVRSYRQQQNAATVREGTQVIGWDAEQHRLRSWIFDADGSFGEGIWQQVEPGKWTCRHNMKLADGRRASFTQVIERANEDELRLQTVAVEVEGLPRPNVGPNLLRRQVAAPASGTP